MTRVAHLLLIVGMIASPAYAKPASKPKPKPPTPQALQDEIDILRIQVAELQKQVAELKKRLARVERPSSIFTEEDASESAAEADRIKQAIAKGDVVVGMAEEQVMLVVDKMDAAGSIRFRDDRKEEFRRGGRTVKQRTLRITGGKWAFEKTIVIEDGVVIRVSG